MKLRTFADKWWRCGVDCVHCKFYRPVFGQQANQMARIEIVGHQKPGYETNADALQRGSSQCFAAIGG